MLLGADSHALRLLANKLEQIAERLNAIESTASSQVNSMPWVGSDADRFRSSWQSTSSVAMRDAGQLLSGAGTAIRSDAQKQDQASSI